MSKYLRDELRNLKEYVPGEQPKESENIIKLNTNENPYPLSPKAVKAIEDYELIRTKLYPNPTNKLSSSWRPERDPPLAPMRMTTPASFAARIISFRRPSGMFPGLMRMLWYSAFIAARARAGSK